MPLSFGSVSPFLEASGNRKGAHIKIPSYPIAADFVLAPAERFKTQAEMELEKIRILLELFGASRLNEMTVTEGGTTIRMARSTAAPVPQQAPATKAVSVAATLNAPMFGIVHRAPDPGAAPLVQVGDTVAAGQPICVIEAMKVFNTVHADRAGTIARVLFEDGAEVEADQPLVEYA
jgi:acetyl-CoA carboxylase biotin carboxyl carrier protein